MDTKSIIKEVIINLVEDLQGCKLTELITNLIIVIQEHNIESFIKTKKTNEFKLLLIDLYSTDIDTDFIINLLEELCETGEIICINYTLPSLLYKNKTFILPKYTKVQIQKTGKNKCPI